jgi:uncharacterized protein
LSATDSADPDHRVVVDILTSWQGELVISAFTAAEADYLILSRLGIDAELLFLRDLAHAYTVESLTSQEIDSAADICARCHELELGLADASIVMLADRWRTTALATFDQRHFRTVAPLQGGAFELLPADQPVA